MQAINSALTKFIGASDNQYCIPIFQRPYSWELNDVSKLLEDIIAVSEDTDRPCHFIGSVIYLPQSQFASQIKPCSVIDGQQRLTTLSLIFLALAHYSRDFYESSVYKESETRYEQISELYLLNKFGKGDLRYRIKLCGDDFTAYKKLFEIEEMEEKSDDTREEVIINDKIKANRVYTNYTFICKMLKNQKKNPQSIIEGIRKLLLVDIPLNVEDNAQLVFETVNSTGRPLTEAQKIKNYILMTVKPEKQEELYQDCWLPMEKGLKSFEFDDFFRYYMTVKLEKQIPKKYYDDFKEYAKTSKSSTIIIVQEIKRYYDYYIRWKNAEQSKNDVDTLIANIKATGQYKVTPVILKVLNDMNDGLCTTCQAKNVLKVIETYWMRRMICGFPSNTAGTVCFNMLKNTGKVNYVDDFIQGIYELTWAQRMPDDDTVKSKLHEVEIYGKGFERILLDRMESHENKDYIHSSNHSIEHVMPQTISSHDELYARNDLSDIQKEKLDWALDLGEKWQQIHQKYCNTIGNLTLTGFNSEYKNYRFIYKKEMKNGYSESPIRLTLKTIANKEKWGEIEILERSDEMAKIICDIWKYPKKTNSDEHTSS